MSDQENSKPQLSFWSVIRSIGSDAKSMVQDELRLARVEAEEKTRRSIRDSVILAVGLLLGFVGITELVTAGTIGLRLLLEQQGFEPNVAALLSPAISGLIILLLGILVMAWGIHKLDRKSFTLPKTSESLKENKTWLQNKIA